MVFAHRKVSSKILSFMVPSLCLPRRPLLFIKYYVVVWSDGIILASGAKRSGFDSQNSLNISTSLLQLLLRLLLFGQVV